MRGGGKRGRGPEPSEGDFLPREEMAQNYDGLQKIS